MSIGFITPDERAKLKAAKKVRADIRKRRESSRPPMVKKAGQEPRVRDNTYLAWIRRLPCVACMCAGVEQTSRVEAAHIRAGFAEDGWRPTGMQERPSDFRVGPLCRFHHREGPDAQHGMNERKFWERLGIHPPQLCAALRQAYDRGAPGAPVIRSFATSTMRKNGTEIA